MWNLVQRPILVGLAFTALATLFVLNEHGFGVAWEVASSIASSIGQELGDRERNFWRLLSPEVAILMAVAIFAIGVVGYLGFGLFGPRVILTATLLPPIARMLEVAAVAVEPKMIVSVQRFSRSLVERLPDQLEALSFSFRLDVFVTTAIIVVVLATLIGLVGVVWRAGTAPNRRFRNHARQRREARSAR